MKLDCLFIGKTSEKYIEEGIQVYLKRLTHYLPVSISIIPSSSVTGNRELVIKKETEAILKKITNRDFVILLDERGKEFNSIQFADFLSKSMVEGKSKIVFIVGGAYGVNEQVVKRADFILSFSKFTLTHQMIRLFLMEQVYRAMTIIRNEQYHHS